ncbi:MAG: helix-turn-helix domain-containing protein [Oscillospiraceae bacterium]|nr:helix-turn-helix domain-containing protein [Oscillospiraceae bacterium]
MKTKDTNDLQKELTSAPDLSRFLSENKEHFINENFSDLLQALFQKSGLSKAALAKRAGTSEVYLYQIFSGDRTPSRDRTICLCFGLSATLEETQELLKHSGLAQLYAKDRRDAIIIYGLSHSMSLAEINDKLFAENEATLC